MVAPSPYRTAIIDCVKSGMTNSEIVKKLKVSRVLVFRSAQRYRRLGTSDDMQRRGRPVTVTTPEAVKAQEWCRANFPEFISAADWPASSLDLNPMDYAVWIYLTEKVSSKNYPSIKALKTALIKKWDEIDDDYLRDVIDAYPKRLKAVIKRVPQITCSKKSISVNIDTNIPFQGRITTVNRVYVPDCNEDYSTNIQKNASFKLDISRCTDVLYLKNGSRVLTAYVEIGFHPLVITNSDRIYAVECLDNTAPPALSVPTPEDYNCTHLVRMASKWESVSDFQVGDAIVHEWSCTIPNKELGKTQMFLTSCNAVSQNGNVIHLIDETGCVIDSELMGDVVYNAFVPKLYSRAKIFKLLTDEKFRIECSLEFCHKNSACKDRAFPPKCAFTREEILKRFAEERSENDGVNTIQQGISQISETLPRAILGTPVFGYDRRVRVSTDWLTVKHNQYTSYRLLTTMDPNFKEDVSAPVDHFLMSISYRDQAKPKKRDKAAESQKIEAARSLQSVAQPILSPAVESEEDFIESITSSSKHVETLEITENKLFKPIVDLSKLGPEKKLIEKDPSSTVVPTISVTNSTVSPPTTSTGKSTSPSRMAEEKPLTSAKQGSNLKKKKKESVPVFGTITEQVRGNAQPEKLTRQSTDSSQFENARPPERPHNSPAQIHFYTDATKKFTRTTPYSSRKMTTAPPKITSSEKTTDLPFKVQDTTFMQLVREEKKHGHQPRSRMANNGADWRLDDVALNDTEVTPEKQVSCANATIISGQPLCRWSGVEHLLLIWSFASLLVWMVMIAVCFYRHSSRKPRWMTFREQELKRATQSRVLQHEHPWLHADAFEERNRGKHELDINKF
ncbi:unnamed protein product [Caenorhabditis auriculariae]|uniref:ZP domain-containing protein n=1 Tax=Caenorhabditis auriculariae TaxID=2777116 RepID=A0A8S1GWK8_9PELO|nr:unnamed protein product [Caenorhabditis auriculariae]